MPPDVGDRFVARYPVQYGEAGQCSACPAISTTAGDLDALGFGAYPCLA